MDAYIPLTLKYRPQTLDDVVGQDNIVEMLKNSVSSGRINHVYLFVGPAGTGKTSTARIWSKMLNCKSEYPPCCECAICKSIASGNSLDVLELNAADKRKIEDMREVLGRIRFKPQSHYRIIILDEVHMLTTEAWNALLKDLEEPPEYCIFILCTTNPEKIPTTILSRCLTFEFHSVLESEVVDRLAYICDEEGYTYDDKALELIAHKSGGGMRDALSSLEQVSTFGQDDISVENVNSLLDIIDEDTFNSLVQSLYEHDVESAISVVDELVLRNKSVDMIYEQLQDGYGSLMRNHFKHGKKQIGYSKVELLSICKLFVDYESKMKFANDKYYVLISLLYDITNKASDDINERLAKLEEMVASGNFKTDKVDKNRIDRIRLALNGKQDRAKELKAQSEGVNEEVEQHNDEYLDSFLRMSGAKVEQ